MNGLAHGHQHHPWASEYTPTRLPSMVNVFFLHCLSVSQCVCSGVQNTDGSVKGTTDTLARQEKIW